MLPQNKHCIDCHHCTGYHNPPSLEGEWGCEEQVRIYDYEQECPFYIPDRNSTVNKNRKGKEMKGFVVVSNVKPECKLIGEDGNIFNLIGIAARALRRAGMPEQADEMADRIMNEAEDYDHALRIIMEYVEVC